MRAYRSPTKLFAFGIIGIILIVASIDVMFAHWISTPPEANDGVLTTRGHAQRRGDLLWGTVMMGTGIVLVGGAVVELVRRKPQAVVNAAGLTLAIGPKGSDARIEWGNVRAVDSDVGEDEFDGSVREYLVVDVVDREGLPETPMGADWEGNRLLVDSSDWTRHVTDVALSAQGTLDHFRRVDAIKQMEAPSLVWETTVTASENPPDDTLDDAEEFGDLS